MTMRFWPFATATMLGLLFAGGAGAQYPIADRIAEKIIEKYEKSTCEQLWQEKAQPKSVMEEHAIQDLKSNPQLREHFINKVAAPMANKMFECGMIP